jgi:hypothetical protein
MAIKKISEFTALTTPADGDLLVVVDVSEALDINKTKKIAHSDLLSAVVDELALKAYQTMLYRADGRLTLESGVPVSSADQSDKTTLYYTPCVGDTIALYDGASKWGLFTFAELSLDISGFTASKPYDIFVYDDSGSPTLEGLVWTNASTRATALAYQDGVLVKNGATTRRYVGTIYMAADAKCDDSNASRLVWNMYNRTLKKGINIGASGGSADSYNLGSTYFIVGHPNGMQVLGGISGNCSATNSSYCAIYLLYDGGGAFAGALVECGVGSSDAIKVNAGASVPALFATGYHYLSIGLNVQDNTPTFDNGRVWFMMEM